MNLTGWTEEIRWVLHASAVKNAKMRWSRNIIKAVRALPMIIGSSEVMTITKEKRPRARARVFLID